MMNDIIMGIAEKLRTAYGEDGYQIYTEKIEQGAKKPCFYITNLTSQQRNLLDVRYSTTNRFAVHYFSDCRNTNENCYEVMSNLYNLLEYITVDGSLCRGIKMEAEVKDGILLFFVNYNMIMKKTKAPNPNMERVKVNAETKTE